MSKEQIQRLRNNLEQQKGQRFQVESTIETLEQEIKEKTRDLHRHEQAREIIKEVGIKTQQQLQFHISDMTSLALETVFDDPYQLQVEFVQRRNKTECDLLFVRDGERNDPLDESGYGAVDVAAFALRIASWSMQHPHSRNTIIMDESFKHLKGIEANRRVLQMINEISKRLHIQIIMISDERISREDIIDNADRVFEVRKVGKVSQVKVL